MKILMLSSEIYPYAKTGGLADVVPALSLALSSLGHDVRLAMPRYYSIDRQGLEVLKEPLSVLLGSQEVWSTVYKTYLPKSSVPIYFFDHENFFGREGLYGPDGGSSWPDNAQRFSFLSAASFQLCRALSWTPDVFHLHDWPTAPAAFWLKNYERYRGFSQSISILNIHNLGYQGCFPAEQVPPLPTGERIFSDPQRRQEKSINFLQLGLQTADELITVSPTYAQEILQPDYGEGLENILLDRLDRLKGILNGIDYTDWNPAHDPALTPHHYTARSMEGKAALKAAVQQEMGLPKRKILPLFALVSRLTDQKGVDLISEIDGPVAKIFAEERAQLILLGKGEKKFEEALLRLVKSYPKSCAISLAFDDRLARRFTAAADFFLMPSRYEPCGLNQMYSLRYATLPLVRRTGGLADTVQDLQSNKKRGNGFLFDKASSQVLAEVMETAIVYFQNHPQLIAAARKRGMACRFDWKKSAELYLRVYRRARRRQKKDEVKSDTKHLFRG